ncbi:MAG: bifunctional metallophosphatase/5'-nucleotidase [Deltaproteobacteria bacterium]|nr:bifunctional metallophosphatase/5'-nucleotidase [Deltaproteobacteria bacterium]
MRPRSFVLFACIALFPATVRAQSKPAVATSAPASGPTSRPETTAPAPAAHAHTNSRQLHVLFTSDIYGRYTWPGCKKPPNKDKANLAHLLGAAQALRREAAQAGDPAPLLVHAGSILRPDIMGNFIFRDAPKLAPMVADIFAKLRFDAISLGLFDFGAAPKAVARLERVFSAKGVPLLASNVTCSLATDKRCSAFRDPKKRYRIIERDGIRVGIFAVLRKDLHKRILSRGVGRVDAADPVSFSRKLLRTLRTQEKVDVIIVLANVNLENNAPKPVLDYVRRLGKDAPDLVVANAMFERGSKAGYLKEIRRGKTLIVGTDRFGQHLGHAELTLERKDARWHIAQTRVAHLDVRRYPADKKTLPTLQTFLRALCEKVNQPIGKGVFERPITYPEFLDYIMQVMRRRTHAEVAAINDSGIADTSFPMSGSLTWEKILRALRTETNIGYVLITGSRLTAVLGKYATSTGYGLHVLGLKKVKGKWKINGRPLIKGHSYRVATTAFVAGGGDGLVSFKKPESFHNFNIKLRDVTTDFFGGDGEADHDAKIDVNVEKDFPDLGKKWLLYGNVDLGFGLSTVNVSNGANNARYSLPLLRRSNVASLAGNFDASLGASTRNHSLELDLSLNYGKTWTTIPVEDPVITGTYQDETTSAESLDRITATFIYKLRAIRNIYGSAWYIPEPYGELRMISEFTASGKCSATLCKNATDQTYHYMDLGGTLGLGLNLHPLFFVKLGAVVRSELLTPQGANPDITEKPGLYIGYLLRRWKVLANPEHPLELESRLDFYFTDLADQLRRELTLSSKLYFSLTRHLALTLGHRLYVFDKRCRNDDAACKAQGDDASVANDIIFGIAARLDFRAQTF